MGFEILETLVLTPQECSYQKMKYPLLKPFVALSLSTCMVLRISLAWLKRLSTG
jgi:hypothetical protein